MTKTSAVAACGIVASVGLWRAEAVAVQQLVFRAAVDMVSVPVSVSKGGSPVAGLTAADFELFDNGVRQQLDASSLETLPIDVTQVFGAAPTAALAQLERGATLGDKMRALLHADDRVIAIDASADVRERELKWTTNPSHDPQPQPTAGMSLSDGVFLALARPIDPDRRHLVIVFSNGNDTWSTLESERLPEIAARSDAVLHAIVYGPKPAAGPYPQQRWRDAYLALEHSADRTGGAMHQLTDSVAGFQQILDDFRHSYVLRYTPKGVAVPGWHDLTVRLVKPAGLTLRARKGYSGG
jgi:hypothetical protein